MATPPANPLIAETPVPVPTPDVKSIAMPLRTTILEGIGLFAYTMMVMVVLGRMACVRMLWFDEWFTVHLARDPLLLWRNLCAGVDNNPPFTYLLSSAAVSLFGESPMTLRLPAILAAGLTIVFVYLFARKRGIGEAMLAASTVGITAPIWIFFVEARPYGVLMAITAFVMLAWQRNWRFGFAIGMILGMFTHYYFILPIMALGIAEVARNWTERRINVGIWIGFVLATVTLLMLSPHWRNTAKNYGPGFWSRVKLKHQVIEDNFASYAAKDLVLPTLGALALAGLTAGRRNTPVPGYTLPEKLLIVGIVAGPLLGIAVGAKITGAFHFRYAIAATLGMGLLFAQVIGQASGTRWACIVASVGFALSGMATEWKLGPDFFQKERNDLKARAELVRQQSDSATILITSPFEYLHLWNEYPELQGRIGFLCDQELAMKCTKSDTVERGLTSLDTLTPLHLYRCADIMQKVETGESVYLLGPANHWQVTAWGGRIESLHDNQLHRLLP